MADIVVKERTEDLNKIRFTGMIIGRWENEAAMTVFFRMTTKHGARIYSNTPAIHIFDKDLREKVAKIPLRTKVSIEGYITSNKQRRDEKGEVVPNRFPLQSFVMTDIESVGEDAPDNNSVEIVGAVERAYVARGGNVNFIIVSFREGHYMKRIKVSAFPKDGVNYIDFMAAGTRVKVNGHCSTRSEDTDEGPRYYEYVIADGIEKV